MIKTTRKNTLSAKVDDRQYAAISQLAATSHRKLSDYLRYIIQKEIDATAIKTPIILQKHGSALQ